MLISLHIWCIGLQEIGVNRNGLSMTSLCDAFEKRCFLVLGFLCLAFPNHALAQTGEWEKYSETPTLIIYLRDVKGSSVPEFKAVGIVEASPDTCWKVIQNFPGYTRTMPFIKESRIVDHDSDGIFLYSIIDPEKHIVFRKVWPRDFTIKVVSDSNAMTARWEIAENRGPEARDGFVRVNKNTGSWQLRPLSEDGIKTEITYQIHTEPGGDLGGASRYLPKWLKAWANSDALPELFRRLAEAVKLPEYQ